jgi:trimeric autotransporter adhesin
MRFKGRSAAVGICAALGVSMLLISGGVSVAAQSSGPTRSTTDVPATQPAPKASVASILRADGSLRSDREFGSFEATGYRMVLCPGGSPRFVSSEVTSSADANWDYRFGLPGVQNEVRAAQVNAIAVDGADVYVGGIFTFAGDSPHAYVLEWDGQAWQNLSGGLKGAPSGESPEVDALALSGTTLYVGGIFTTARNGTTAITVHDVAAWDTVTEKWSALGGGVAAFALAVNGSTLIAGGDFTRAGSVTVNSLAVWSGSAWAGLDGAKSGVTVGTGSSASEGAVDALLVSGATLYVGGAFDHLLPGGRATKGGLASFNLTAPAWTVLPMEQAPATVNSFAAPVSSGVYVGGSFDTGGPLTTGLFVDNIGLLNGQVWSAFGEGVTYGENSRGFTLALAHGSSGEYVGGWFDQVGSVRTNG